MDYKSRRNPGIDLHAHSTASDGTLTPIEIITLAQQSNLAAVAITDHDTLEGVRQVLDGKMPVGIHFLTGIEISIHPPQSFPVSGSLHLLGYGIRVDEPTLNNALYKLRESRKNRNPQIIAKLNTLGLAISYDEVQKELGDGQLGRPHIASCLVKKGYAADIDDAFNRFLGAGQPAYVDRYRITATQAISHIRAAGGVPVLAHPDLYGLPDFETLREMVAVLMKEGMMGIEVYCPGHSKEVTASLVALARQLDLLMTGGTDFHGALKPEIQLGTGSGDFFVPFKLYEKLVNRLPG